MSQPESTSRDLTDEEYRRECTLRNSAFIKARRTFVECWQSEQDLFAEPIVVTRKVERGKGLDAIKEQQRKQGQFLAEVIRFCNAWPSITPQDVIGGATSAPGPKVRLASYSPLTWPRDGSLLLSVDPTTTGEEIKQQWQKIKRGLGLIKHRSRAEKALKIRIYDLRIKDGKDFRKIAKATGKPASTVFSLFVSACRDIGHVIDKKQKRKDPAFDLQEHFSGCSSCQTGRLCRLAEEKTGVKIPYLRERPISDPNRFTDENSDDS